jgi:hypothetical protein
MGRLYGLLILAGSFATVGWLAYAYYTNTQETIKDLTVDNVRLEQALESSERTLDEMETNYSKLEETFEQTESDFQDSRNRVRNLEEKLSRHDLGSLAVNKPVLVERVIDKATRNINRCFEILSGAPRTPEELAATKPSEINAECPGIANPNYTE